MHEQSSFVPWRPRVRETPETRFWRLVARSDDGCWLWTGSVDRDGYGRFFVSQTPRVRVLAHRYSYQLVHGPRPSTVCILHHCDVPACVRVDHLFEGTHTTNHLDMQAKGRIARGERGGLAKLTDAQVVEIRHRYAAGGISQARIAVDYGVSDKLVGYIVRRAIWTHLP